MRKIYLVKKNPELPADGNNWLVMNSFEFRNFIQTPEGQKRRDRFGQLDACSVDDVIIIAECGAETAKQWRSEKDRHDYLVSIENQSGMTVFSYNTQTTTEDDTLAAEWSEKNLPLTPDAVNEKSTKNVWWKCNTCGYEWKAVVKARGKGGMCPVCAERAVLQGYNDLGTTDPYLLSEWDYEKNSKWTPSNVSRNSMKVVWWKCGAGHSYRAKITDRTIEQKGCPQCEAEFQQALPQMLIMMYGAQNGITVKSNSDSELGMRLVAYLPELHCAVDIAGATVTEKREQSVKAHICQSNWLGYYLIKRTADTLQMAAEIKTLFIRNHIYLHTDSEKDVQVLRERFLEWKNRNACKLNGKY